ncbi:MAG TPA: hypothetical protein VJM32_02705 [Candidatus Saccharimonadales bacterium]|nr:hypothetical protein [Candidatus Saccharimonadales bacterium]
MHISWSQDDTEPNKPKAEIYPDTPFYGSLTGITNVQVAYGSNPITVIFYLESTLDLAMREILGRLKGEGCIIGGFTDSRSGASVY